MKPPEAKDTGETGETGKTCERLVEADGMCLSVCGARLLSSDASLFETVVGARSLARSGVGR